VITYKEDNGKSEIFVLDLQGKELKHTWIEFKSHDSFIPNPYLILNDKLYQTHENEENEEIELHVNDIK